MLTNVPSHLNIFWLNFDKGNYSLLHPFRLGRNIFSKKSTRSFEWGTGAWLNEFSGSVNNINWKNFSHTHGGIYKSENSTSILDRDKTLMTLKNMKGCIPEANF